MNAEVGKELCEVKYFFAELNGGASIDTPQINKTFNSLSRDLSVEQKTGSKDEQAAQCAIKDGYPKLIN